MNNKVKKGYRIKYTVPEGVYKANSILGLAWEVFKHRIWHLFRDRKWSD